MGWSNAGAVGLEPVSATGPWLSVILWSRGEKDATIKLEIPDGPDGTRYLHLTARQARRLAFLILAETE